MTRPKVFAASSVCPFCVLHCDAGDEIVDVCPIRGDALKRLKDHQPRIGDKPCDRDGIRRWFAENVSEPSLIAGAMGMASASRLIDWCDDQERPLYVQVDDSMAAIGQAQFRDGVVAASLEDAARVADQIVVLGDLNTHFPLLGEWFGDAAATHWSPSLSQADVAGWTLHEPSWLGGAKSIMFVAGPGSLRGSASEQTVAAERLMRWIWKLNRRTRDGEPVGRAALIAINPAANVQNVFRAARNRPLPRCQSHGDRIRIGSATGIMPQKDHAVALQIGGIDPGVDLATAYLPAAIAGWHVADATLRGDAPIALPLTPANNVTPQPDALECLRELIN